MSGSHQSYAGIESCPEFMSQSGALHVTTLLDNYTFNSSFIFQGVTFIILGW
jgi:hypothetical protein